ncbi:threonine/serine exporter family protein [Actinotalea sp. M2MS4P-6]|uniref:threonine/serine ThrE exporter family protein n=1 Tax=Actinotalea sp. M2MS4P-6 TaxID=2983762 RepID=UPI0021E38111|nr:threonine/serine exporter family protein [Actinotalea sp. M2MS4P-6]MCV2395201.1 threonine/serine exporter family protein [Actinotalea sp. M2MS4P-6]
MGWGVRARLARAIAGGPGFPVAVRAQGVGLDDDAVRSVIDLCLRTGEAMLSLGASAGDVTGAIRRVAAAFGLDGFQVDLTFTSITVSYDPGAPGHPTTLMRVAPTRTTDYDRLARVTDLVRDVTATHVPLERAQPFLEDAHRRLDAVIATPRPYRPSVVTLLLSVMAAAVAVQLGGGWAVAAIAGATTAVITLVVRWLGRRGLPPFFLQAGGAAVATAVAVLLLVAVPRLPIALETLPPSLVVASGIVVLLAGLSLVGAADDALSGFPVTASGRVFEVVLLTLGIVVGIGAVLDAGSRLGVQLVVVDELTGTANALLQVAASAVMAAAWAMASYARLRAAAVAGAAGGAAWLIYLGLRDANVGAAVASAGAALIVGFAAEWFAPRLRVPAIVTSACAIIPLLPGLAIYRGLFLVVEADSLSDGVTVLLGAATVGLGLAAGVTLGELIASSVRHGGTRARRVWSRTVLPGGQDAPS